MKLGSLFDGSGGFPLSGVLNGIEPVWAAEVEPYPIAVTRSRFPHMKHYGDVSKMHGDEIEPVDIITFGSPCQDMSVAGKRAGLDGSRSNLFYEAVRIVKEMRDSTNGEYPKYAVWENVPGAFSSNKGHDFHAVLEALCSVCDGTVSIPKPYDKRKPDKLVWNGAGEIVGDNYSIAWRTLDAQYWGVPQRRKRIYLVADFGSQRAGEILFKPDGLPRNHAESRKAGQGVTADAVGGVDGSVGVECLNPWDCQSKRIYNPDGIYCTLPAMDCGGANNQAVIVLNDQEGSSINVEQHEISPTLRANSHQHEPVIALQANGIDRADTAGCNGCGWRENESYTLNTVDRHAVCYDARGNGDGETVLFEPKSALEENWGEANVKNALRAGASKSSHAVVQETYTMQRSDEYPECNVASTQSARQYKSATDLVVEKKRKYIIRRLTPTECARLQGFPDKWGYLAPYDPADADFWEQVRKTHAEINGKAYKPVKDIKKWYDKLHNDGAEYKMWGNGIALPNARYVIQGIAEHGAKTLGSLFDGSGGFPLAGVLNGITPLWASEVEPYPIAVTKSRFKEVHNGK